MITIYIPGLALKGYEYRRGDAQIIHDDKGNAIVIDGGESDLYTKLIAYCRNKDIKNVTYILTHWHIDHDTGMKAFLDAAGICVDKIYCPPPSELKGLQESGVSDDYNRANRRISQAKNLGKTIIYPAAGKDIMVQVGKIRCRIWRRAANRGDKNDYEVNNTSICTYFPDLYYLTTGDTINAFDIYLSSHKDTVKVFKIPHHGNACTDQPCLKLRNYGAQLCWYNDWEPKGSAIGSTGFSKWGAGYTKKYFTTIRTDTDIVMTAQNKTLKVQKGSSTWTYAIPYDGKGQEGWVKLTNGWCYQYADGTYAVRWKLLKWSKGQNWFYFNPNNGIMLTGWVMVDGYWYYLDPSTGAMRIGWLDYKEKRCYLEPVSGKNQGHAYRNETAKIEGKTYKFDDNCYATEIKIEQSKSTSQIKVSSKPEIIRNKNFKGYNVSARTTPPKYIVMHYTGAEGTAANNISYFNAQNRNASADFFVGHEGDIREYNPNIPKNYTWHCGGSIESSHHPYNGICTNKNSIGVEMCTKKVNGVWTFDNRTLDSAAQLVTWLMKEYDIPSANVIRHYDVTGKNCPGVPGWAATGGNAEWNKWKGRLVETVETPPIYRVRKTWEDAKSQIGAFAKLENAKAYAAEHPGYFVFDDNGNKV